MYPHHVFDLEPAGTFGMYPICYWQVSGRYFQPEPAMYSRCFHWFLGPLTPSVRGGKAPALAHPNVVDLVPREVVRIVVAVPKVVGHTLVRKR